MTPISRRLYALVRKSTRRFQLLLAVLILAVGQNASANAITFDGVQEWDHSPDGMGGWYVDGYALAYYEFFVNAAGAYSINVAPASYLAPDMSVWDPLGRVYHTVVAETTGVDGGMLDLLSYLDIGKHILVFGYGTFEGDEATEGSGYNYMAYETPALFENIAYTITIEGPSLAVPEPGVLLLTLAGLAGLALRRKFARQKTSAL